MVCIVIHRERPSTKPKDFKTNRNRLVGKSLYEIVGEFFIKNKKPAVLRDVYAHCAKFGDWNPRSIRRYVEEQVITGYVVMIKCPCGHSHLYIGALHAKRISIKDNIIKYN